MSQNTELLAALRQAFPQLFSARDEEGVTVDKLDLEKIRVLAGEGNFRDTYGLRWENKPEKFEADSIGNLPTLKRIQAQSIQADPAKPTHVLIEGDNYHALQVLAYTHERSVDVIYIDPPYNTGVKDFKYNDHFVDREDGYRHSKWLSFMAKRLRLAKNLLKDDGLLLVSIDDNEQAQLKLLCDEIFSENNCIAQVIWARKRGRDNSAKFFSKSHEYVLVYAKNKALAQINRLKIEDSTRAQYSNPDGDPRGDYRLAASWARGQQSGPEYSVTLHGIEIPVRKWLYGKERLLLLAADQRVVLKGRAADGLPNVYVKNYLDDHAGAVPETIWDDASNAANGQDELKAILGSIMFGTPKPLGLMERLLKCTTKRNSIVMDFFAGSGTTGHAVMRLNAEDGGSRQCILVTNDEGDFKDTSGNVLPGGICSHVTHPRLKRVIEGYTTPKGKVVEGLGENLEFFRTTFHSNPKTKDQTLAFAKACVPLIELKAGCFQLSEETTSWRLYQASGKYLFILLDDLAGEAALDRLRQIEGPVEAYVFAYDADDDTAASLNSLVNVHAQVVPKPILDLYHRLQEQA